MKIQDILTPEHTQCDITGVSKKRVLEYISNFLSDDADTDTIYQSLLERERLGSTGIGDGVAVPHCRVKGCDRITGALLKLSDQVDFEALDGQPVDLVFALIVPDEQNDEHLDALSAVAELMQEPGTREELRNTHDDRQLYDLAISQGP